MVFYTVLACTPLLVGLAVKLYYQCPINESKRAKRAFLFFSGLILWFFIAFRDKEVGSVDSINYYNNWDNMAFRNFEGLLDNIVRSRMEPGFLCTTWLLTRIFPDPQSVFVLSGMLFVISVCLFIYRNSDNVVISFVMFITWGAYGFMVQGLRQAVAMSICLFAVESVKKRKFFRFLLQVLLAFLYHRSALVFLVVYFIPWKRLCLTNKIQMLGAAALMIACGSIIINIGNTIVEGGYNAPVMGGGFVALILYLLLLVGAFLFIQHSKKVKDDQYSVVLLLNEEERRKETLFICITLLGATFYGMRYTSVQAIERISFYFMFGQIIALPMVVKRFSKSSQFIIYAFAVILSIILFIYRMETSGMTPYKLFFLD